MSDDFPYSQAAENNKEPIANILKTEFRDVDHILEIGSCTGQHAVYFGHKLNHLVWQPSDVPQMIPGLSARLNAQAPDNVRKPLTLDVMEEDWPIEHMSAVYAANIVHIISKPHIEAMFNQIGERLKPGGLLALYGPFKYGGHYTSDSNARFDLWLKDRDLKSGIRHFEFITGLAKSHGLNLKQDHQMPANNQLIIWQKSET